MKKLAILGSTGSIGVNTLEIVKRFPEKFEVVSLVGGRNVGLLKEQVSQFQPKMVSLSDEKCADQFRESLPEFKGEVLSGIEGAISSATHREVEKVVSAISGSAGLLPTYNAVVAGKDIALANKETLVMAGKLITDIVKKSGISLFPIDSEHSAIFQSLLGHNKEDIKRVMITASGGPFLNRPKNELISVTPKEAISHPNWKMGKKISVDSATLMNKGLEIIEAKWLFDIDYEKIVVYIHPQSIVHSMVEYRDGSVIAQMGVPDMRGPISYALAFPDRLWSDLPSLNLYEMEKLTFSLPDEEQFPALRLAYMALKEGESVPAVLNGANEVAVEAFLAHEIKFTHIPEVIQEVLEAHKAFSVNDLSDVLEADRWSKARARKIIERRSQTR
ncbi:MAG: 1-deoxy-D-xylulose-5-phosphate reductoisomerase [Thermodesulfobacteriota bacterium]|nr:1-deoxy-D-xylulose-5-phosphate reductoisomerase [Thermodesulfobacteriota bacterium]